MCVDLTIFLSRSYGSFSYSVGHLPKIAGLHFVTMLALRGIAADRGLPII